MFFAAVVLAVFLDGIRFRQVYATISTGNHAGYGRFSGGLFSREARARLMIFRTNHSPNKIMMRRIS